MKPVRYLCGVLCAGVAAVILCSTIAFAQPVSSPTVHEEHHPAAPSQNAEPTSGPQGMMGNQGMMGSPGMMSGNQSRECQ